VNSKKARRCFGSNGSIGALTSVNCSGRDSPDTCRSRARACKICDLWLECDHAVADVLFAATAESTPWESDYNLRAAALRRRGLIGALTRDCSGRDSPDTCKPDSERYAETAGFKCAFPPARCGDQANFLPTDEITIATIMMGAPHVRCV
jgi:hypothetical protein